MKEGFSRISTILIIGLLLVKVSAFHVYEHHDTSDDSSEHCELCVLILDGQQTEAICSPVTIFESAYIEIANPLKISCYVQKRANTLKKDTLYSRPPPHKLA